MIGKFEGIPFKSETIPIKDGDTLVITIDSDRVDLDISVELYDGICEMYPNNKVICLAKGMTLVKENEEEPVQLKYEGLNEYWGPWGKCPKCGHSNMDFDGYCSYCGAKVRGSNKGE